MRILRLAPSAALIAALVALGVVVPATPATAAPIFDMNQLALAMQGGGTVTLDQDIIDPGTPLYVRNNVTIDFAGYTLSTNSTIIEAGVTLTVTGSGTWNSIANGMQEGGIRTRDASLVVDGPTVTAVGYRWNSGIGGQYRGGDVTLNSGSITATGGMYAAGVGGGYSYGHGGNITVNGGTLIANGGDYGAGIGSGLSNGNGATVTINGGTVIATGGYSGNGIGAGQQSSAGSLFIAEGAVVTSSGGAAAWAIGGATTVAGTLIIPAGQTHSVLVAPTTVTSTGKITGDGAITGNPYVAGAVMTNDGIVTNASVSDINDGGSLTTLNHNYKLSFDANFAGADPVAPVRVYATTLADGVRSLPTPTCPGYLGLGWNTAADGSGTTMTPTTLISSDVTLYAQWSAGGYLISPDTATVTAGTPQQFTVGEIANFSTVDVTSDFSFASDNPVDAFTGGQGTFTIAGDRTVTATKVSDSDVTLDAAVSVIADAAQPGSLELTAPDTTANQFETITLNVELEDVYGNPLPTSGVVITSDQPTDVIVGNTVTFPHASPHVLTATLGTLSDSLLIEVSPAALAATGTDPLLPAGLASLLLLLGVGALLMRRRALSS